MSNALCTGDFEVYGQDAIFFEEVRARRLSDEARWVGIYKEAAVALADFALGNITNEHDVVLYMEEARLDVRVQDAEINEEAEVLLSDRLALIEQDGGLTPTRHCQLAWLREFRLKIYNERRWAEAMK